MSSLLYIESSPRKDRSASSEVARAFLTAFQNGDPRNEIDTIDLWDFQLPEFDGDSINAKYKVLHGENPTSEEAKAWDKISQITTRFKDADSYLFSIPMWNFSIPYKLKHFIDVITQPGLTFSFSPETGYQGLVTGKSCTVIYARGGDYSSAETRAMDLQTTYMEMILGFMGFQDIQAILVEPTLTDPESQKKTIAAAKDQAIALAKHL